MAYYDINIKFTIELDGDAETLTRKQDFLKFENELCDAIVKGTTKIYSYQIDYNSLLRRRENG